MILNPGVDVAARWQGRGSVHYAATGFAIVQASHGLAEEASVDGTFTWRDQLNEVVAARCPLGLYHFSEHGDPHAEATFFRGLVGYLTAAQVPVGWWLDAESGEDAAWVDAFRATVRLPMCGLYSTLSQFNGPLRPYLHFALNWLPLLPGWRLEPGWEMPDHVLTQVGQFAGVDVNVPGPAQPYPAAWAQ